MTTTRRLIPGTAAALLLLGFALAAGLGRPARHADGQQSKPAGDEFKWLEDHSMLRQAREAAALVSGRADQWRHPYGTPQPRQAVRHASVWLLDYPGSVVTAKGRSV